VTWRVATVIAEKPDWNDAHEQWRWNKVTATVTLAGSGDLPDQTEIQRAVCDYLKQHQRPGAPPPAVTVHVVPQGTVSTNAAPAAPPSPVEGWRYTLKSGDTLALLSIAFYGTPEHWRRILDANPGLRAEDLSPGVIILIPPAP